MFLLSIVLVLSLLSTTPIFAMSDSTDDFICLICHQNMIPQNQSDIQVLAQDWAEHRDLLCQLNDLDAFFQKYQDLKNYLSSLSKEMLQAPQQKIDFLIQRKVKHPEIDSIIKSFIIEKLECHEAPIPQFHVGCLRNALTQNNQCPVCRRDFTQEMREGLGLIQDQSKSKKIQSMFAIAILFTFLFIARSELTAFLTSDACSQLLKLACVIAVPLSIAMTLQPGGTRLYQVEAFLDGEEIVIENGGSSDELDDVEFDV